VDPASRLGRSGRGFGRCGVTAARSRSSEDESQTMPLSRGRGRPFASRRDASTWAGLSETGSRRGKTHPRGPVSPRPVRVSERRDHVRPSRPSCRTSTGRALQYVLLPSDGAHPLDVLPGIRAPHSRERRAPETRTSARACPGPALDGDPKTAWSIDPAEGSPTVHRSIISRPRLPDMCSSGRSSSAGRRRWGR